MPKGDGTGPLGIGPMTGRGLGFCAGFGTSGYVNPGFGAGFGRGCGRGWGFRRIYGSMAAPGLGPAGFPVFGSEEAEKEYLNRQAKVLENQLEQVKKRLQKFSEEQETQE
ncbi:MAG TPA: DUF5320 domain-containing protein [Firmicutes bacterium]|nr:DUF5320 domain-containing protein [Bacillota bacterium]